MMESVIQLSVVVACRNESEHIRELLDSIVQQDLIGITWEAVVADGMSTDDTRSIIEEYAARHPQIRLVDNPGQIVSTGLNRAIREATGAVILRMDAHTSYAPDYCRRCLEVLFRTGADNVGGPARTKATTIRARAIAAAYHSRFSTGGARFHNSNYCGWVDTVPYGCWHKSTVQRIGLFDESLVRNQDDELNLRLVRSGGKIWQDPSIVSWYSTRGTLSRLFRQYFQYGYWKVAVIRKHRLPASWRHLVPVFFILGVAGMLASVGLAAILKSPVWLNASSIGCMSIVLLYGLLNVAASCLVAAEAGWSILPFLPLAFLTYHVSYGLGFLCGLRWTIHAPVASARASVFTSLSR